MSSSTELLEIIGELEDHKRKRSEAEGALKQIEADLKEKHDCSSIKEADDLISELAAEIREETEAIESDMAQLSEDMTEAGL